MMMRPLSWLPLLALLAGCATQDPRESSGTDPIPLAPDQVTLPTAWRHEPATESVVATAWWKSLNDPVLNDLIAQAQSNNPDLKITRARLNEIKNIAAEADSDEKETAAGLLLAAENDAHVIQLGVTHTVVTTYLEAQLADKRKEILQQRMQLAHDLTARLHRKLEAGLINSRSLRESEQTEIETRTATEKNHHDRRQAVGRLALLTGLAPIEFKLTPGTDPLSANLELRPDLPSRVIERRPDVQAAWQRLLVATMSKPDGDLPLAARLDLAEASIDNRDALYRKSVLAALQEVEAALSGWRSSRAEAGTSAEFLEIQSANVHDLERELTAGRISQIELLKAKLAENLAQENALLAQYALRGAFAATQLALARN